MDPRKGKQPQSERGEGGKEPIVCELGKQAHGAAETSVPKWAQVPGTEPLVPTPRVRP